MGGHGGLNILPQKSWNVYSAKNRARVAAVQDPMFWNRAGVNEHLEEAKRQLLAQHKAPEGQSKRDQQQANRSWDSVLDWLDVELANFAKTKVEL